MTSQISTANAATTTPESGGAAANKGEPDDPFYYYNNPSEQLARSAAMLGIDWAVRRRIIALVLMSLFFIVVGLLLSRYA